MTDRRDEIKKWRVEVTSRDYRYVVKRVALVLADEFGPDGTVGMSNKVLSVRAEVSDASVTRALKQLVADGLLDVEPSQEPDGSAGPNFYSVPVAKPAPAKKKAAAKKADTDDTPAVEDTPEDTPVPLDDSE